jgi:carboxyl-terminal processing protease
MEEKRTRRRVPLWGTILLCLLCLFVGGALALGALVGSVGAEGLAILQLYQLVEARFVGDYDQETYHQQVMEAQVEALGDRWSYYLTPEEYAMVQETRANEYVGIGISVQYTEGEMVIYSVTPGGPAEEAGLLAGESILAVGDIAVTEEDYDQAVDAIKGEEGSSLTLTIRGTDGTERTVTLTREAVQGVSATWTMLEGQIGYVALYNFYTGVADQVEQGVEELQAQGARALVLDVRNNPGGYVTELTEILDYLLPEGDIFISQETGGEREVYTSDPSCVDLPLAVLVNGDSYSAAEFLAAQLRESAGAVVAGTKTCGKGYFQALYSLADGSAVGLSSGRYYTGAGVSLIGTGVVPDPSVELTEEAQTLLLQGRLDPADDLQLQAAIRALDLDD